MRFTGQTGARVSGTRMAICGVAGVIVLALASGCDAGGQGSTVNDPDGEVAANSAGGDAANASGPALHEAGSLTLADTAGSPVSYTLTFSVPDASELPQVAPDDVLDACNANYTTTKATLVPISARLQVAYNGGSLPEVVTLVPNELLGSPTGGSIGSVAIPDSGGWACQDPVNFTVDAGQTLDLSVWLLPQLLSNTHPSVDAEVLNYMQVMAGGFSGGSLSYITKNTSSGPGGFCSGRLYLYATTGACSDGS